MIIAEMLDAYLPSEMSNTEMPSTELSNTKIPNTELSMSEMPIA